MKKPFPCFIYFLLLCFFTLQPFSYTTAQYWSQIDFEEDLKTVSFLNAEQGWVLTESLILRYTNDKGVNWEDLIDFSFVNNNQTSKWYLEFTDVQTGYLFPSIYPGTRTIYKTTDGGRTWSELQINTTNTGGTYLVQMDFIDNNIGYVVANNSIVYKTLDGGSNWEQLSQGANHNHPRTAMFISESIGYIGGNYDLSLYKTEDGGNSFFLLDNAPINNSSESLSHGNFFFLDESLGFVPNFIGTDTDSNNDFIVSKTEDGGFTWSIFGTSRNINDLLFVDNSNGWIIGSEGIHKTQDGGEVWQEQYSENGNRISTSNAQFLYGDATDAWIWDKHSSFLYQYHAIENDCAAEDRIALEAFYEATDGDNWTNNENWKSELPLEEWYGVTTDENGCVTILDINNNELSGELPDFKLSNLRAFYCNENKLTGKIPDFSNLPQLQVFQCIINNLSGEIPNFSSLPNLQTFRCSHNKLNGKLVDFSNLPNLQDFHCGVNDLIGDIPDFSNLPKLIDFYCGSNDLTGEIPDFSDLPNLQSFTCSSNKLIGAIPGFSNLLNLQSFFCSNNQLSGCFSEELINQCNIFHYDFSNNLQLPWQGDFLRFCNGETQIGATCDDGDPNTENDRIQDCVCQGTTIINNDCAAEDRIALEAFYEATDGDNWTNNTNWKSELPLEDWYGVETDETGCITSIELIDNNLGGTLIDLNLPNLQTFLCYNNNLSGSIPDFSNLPNLQYFHCGENQLTGSMPDFSNLPNLHHFCCGSNQLTGSIPNFSNLPELKRLSCGYNDLNGSIPFFLNSPNLQSLHCANSNLSGCFPENLCYLTDTLTDCSWNNNELEGCQYNFSGNPQLPWQGDFARLCNGETQIGATCNDGDPNTVEDTIQEDCVCQGTPITNNDCGTEDRAALVALYNATDGDNWTNNENWKSELPLEEWYGVTLNENGCVIQLSLDSNNLNGILPDLNLPNLYSLYCWDNNLSGSIPDFSNLPNLINFFCWDNNLSGSIPDFSNLPNLIDFFCWDNNLSGSIPDFSNLPNLQYFHCGGNNLNDSIPDFFNLPNLQTFDCVSNNLSGSIPDFSNLPDLQLFNCSQNNLDGLMPDFSNLPNLIDFFCWDNNLSGSIPGFSNLPNLEAFNCGGNNLSGSIPDFSNLPDLKSLICSNNNLSGCFPESLCYLTNPDLTDCSSNNNELEGCQYDFRNNAQLPWQGNFAKFCNGELQTGATCDDGDPNTVEDTIQEDCVCQGTPITNNDCAVEDRAALVDLYNATDGSNWTNNENWIKTGTVLQDWHGIKINADGCVQGLDFDGVDNTDRDCSSSSNWNCLLNYSEIPSGNNFSGIFPAFNFPALELLNLSGNTLNELPKLNGLLNLNSLYLRYVQFTNLVALADLDIPPVLEYIEIVYADQLSGELPDFQSTNLKSLFLHHNKLAGTIPMLRNAPNLIQLHLEENDLIGTIPDFQLQRLSLLNLSKNNLNGPIPSLLESPKLKFLYLASNKLKGTVPDFSTKNLKEITLEDNELDSLPPSFVAIDILEKCSVKNNRFTFDDILPNMYIPEWTYAPQDSIFVDTTIIAMEGEALTIDLLIDAAVPNSRYKWFKDEIFLKENIGNNRLVLLNMETDNAGTYRVEITNPDAPDLTLYSRLIKIEIETFICQIITTNLPPQTICGTTEINGLLINTDTIFIDTLMTDFGCDSMVQRTFIVIPAVIIEDQLLTYQPNDNLSIELYDLADCPDCTVTILSMNEAFECSDPNGNILNCNVSDGVCDSLKIQFEVYANNCLEAKNTASISLYNQQDCEIPYYISPNGDGIEDNFVIPKIYDDEKYRNYELIIFNRDGLEVYRANEYEPDGWDGTLHGNGRLLPDGYYGYLLKLDNADTPPKMGEISIIR